MSRPEGLGSPHPRGSRQPRPTRLTWRERVNEITSGCGLIIVLVLFLPVVGIGVVAYYFGIHKVADVITEWSMDQSIIRTLLGVTLIVLAALGWVQVYRHRSGPEFTARAVISWAVVSVFMILIGAGILMADFSDGTDTTGSSEGSLGQGRGPTADR
jgi:hypothetical protein